MGLSSLASLAAGCAAGTTPGATSGIRPLSASGQSPLDGRGSGDTSRSGALPEAPNGPLRIAPSEESDVLSAWRAAEQAFESAALSADASAPGLGATTTEPQLSYSEDLLAAMSESGEAATGPVDLGHPTVVASTTSEATVRSCLHDAEVVVVLSTGRPVPGIAGQIADELVISLMTQADGEWKLADQSVRPGACRSR